MDRFSGTHIMKTVTLTTALLAAAGLCASAQAQSLNEDEAEVWGFIESAWAEHSQASSWHEVLHEDGFGWGSDAYPMGRDRATMARYAEQFGGEEEILFMELSPVRIARHGDTAIAFYYAHVISNDHAGERTDFTEQCADTVVRGEDGWMFLGWGCRTLGDDD